MLIQSRINVLECTSSHKKLFKDRLHYTKRTIFMKNNIVFFKVNLLGGIHADDSNAGLRTVYNNLKVFKNGKFYINDFVRISELVYRSF